MLLLQGIVIYDDNSEIRMKIKKKSTLEKTFVNLSEDLRLEKAFSLPLILSHTNEKIFKVQL